VHAILSEICSSVTKHRLLLKPNFQDFDRRNEDHVTREQFMRALSMFHLLPQDAVAVDLLCKAFSPTSYRQSSGEFVNYRKFLDYITGITDETERQQLLLTADAFKDVPRHLRTDFTPTKADTAKPAAYDASPTGHFSPPPPFANSDVPDDEEKKWGEEDTLDELTNTYDFGSVTGSLGSPSKSSVVTGRADRPLDIIMADIRRSVLENRIRLTPFFEDHDKLHKGKISRDRFYRGLTSAGSRLSEYEAGLICHEYGDLDDVDGDGVPYVRWAAFVDDINTIFAIQGLENNPNIDVASTIRSIRATAMNSDEASVLINEDDNEALSNYLAGIAGDVARKNIDLFPPFEDFDRFHRGTVTANM
jgi:Ca2+-binding EF-hand superfamily protein